MKPTRRELLGTLALAAAGHLARGGEPVGPLGSARGRPARIGKFRHSVCRWAYRDIPLPLFAEQVKKIGLSSVELLDPPDWPVVQARGLTCAMANGTMTIKSGLNRLENHDRYVPTMIERIKACSQAGLPNVICFSGSREGMADEQGLDNCAIGVKKIVGAAEKHGVTLCMELLNSKRNHPDYMCDHSAWGVELVKRVGSDRFKLLYDIYHMQIMEGDLITTIQAHADCIAHYHTGGVPGRHEIDGSQEICYPAVMRAIAGTGFKGFVAQEFQPTRDPLTSLAEAVRICTV